MSITIKNKEAERLLDEIKARTGRGASDLLLDLLRRERERLARDEERDVAEALDNMRSLQHTWRSLPVVDPRPPEEVVAYDEDGLPK
jgi:hypothetical protein